MEGRRKMSRRKVLLLGGVVLLTLALALGCSLLPRENVAEGDGWYIKLRIQAPASQKGSRSTSWT